MKRKILTISGIIFFLLVVGGYFILSSSFLLNKIRGMVEDQLTNQLRANVKLGRLSGNLLYGIKIEDVAITDKKKPGQTIISMKALGVKYKLSKLLLRTIAVKELTLQKPVINMTVDEKGNVNLAELIPKQPTPDSKEKKPSFLIQAKEFKLVDGHINYEDKLHNIDANISGIHLHVLGPLSPWNHRGKLTFQNAVVEVNDVKKRIGTFEVDFHFTQDEGRLERLRLEMENSWLEARADTNFKSPSLQAKVNGEIDLKDMASFSPLTKRLEGIVSLKVSANGIWNALVGHIELTAPNVLLNDLHVADISIDADFTNNSMKILQLSANIAEMNRPLGSSGNILATAQAQITDGQTDYDAQLSITSIQLQPLLSMLLFAPGDDGISRLPTLTGKMKLNGRGTDLKFLNTEGQFEFSDGTFNGAELLPSMLNYTLKNEQLTVNANFDRIRAEIYGHLDLTDKTDLKMNLTSIDMGRLAQLTSPAVDIKGMGTLQTRITGELIKPTVEAYLTVDDIAMNGTRLGDATGKFLYSENHVQIDELRLSNANTQGVIRGNITLSDNPTVDLKVALNPLQLDEYTVLAGTNLDVQGQVLGEITLHGPITALNGRGELVTREMQAFSAPIEMTIPIQLKEGILHIPQLVLKTAGGEVHLSAAYNPPNGEYEFQVNSGDLDLASLLDGSVAEPLKGFGQLTGSGKGVVSNPKANIQLDLKSIQYGDVKIGDVVYNGRFDRDKFQFNAAALADTFKLEGEVNAIQPMPFNVTAKLENLDLGVLLESLGDENIGKLSGETTGQFIVNGEIADIMNSRGTIQLQSLTLNTSRHRFFNSTPIEIAFANQTIDVKQFKLSQETAGKIYSALTMRGSIRRENFDFIVQSDEFNLAILNDFISNEPESGTSTTHTTNQSPVTNHQSPDASHQTPVTSISGAGKFNLHLTGSYSKPEFVFNWEFPEMSVETSAHLKTDTQSPATNIPINSKGQITYRDKLLTIDPIKLELYSNPLTLQGAVPLDLTTLFHVESTQSLQSLLQGRLSDSPMQIQLLARNWNISFIDQFTADIEKADGYANVNIQVSGSPVKPLVSGNINLNDISLQLTAIPQPLEHLSAAIKVNLDLLNKVGAKQRERASPLLTCVLDSLEWNIGRSRYSAFGSVQCQQTEEITSWFDTDGLNAIKDSIASQKIELTFRGEDMDLGALASLPFDGRASVVATVKGRGGMKLVDYTASIKIEPLELVVGEYNLRSQKTIEISFQDGRVALEPLILTSQKADPVAKLSLSGSTDLDGNFNFQMHTAQFNLKNLSSLLTNVPTIDGLVSIQLKANGTPAEPEAFARFEIQNIKVQNISAIEGDINVDQVKGSIALKNGTLTVNPISLAAYDNELTFYGTIPLNLTKPPEYSEPTQLFIKGENINLAPFAAVSPVIEEISGIAHIDMALRDNPFTTHSGHKAPLLLTAYHLTGNLTMKDGRIKLANFDTPIEAIKFDLVAQREMKYELSLQLSSGKYRMTGQISMDGLMPQRYDGRVGIKKFPLDIIARNFLKGEVAEKLSGYFSLDAETKVNVGDLLNVPPTLKPEQRLAKLMETANGSKVTLPEIRVYLAGHPIYNTEPVVILLDEGILTLPNCKLDYQRTPDQKTVFLRAYGRWEPKDKLLFAFKGSVDTQMIAELTQLSNSLAELTKSSSEKEPISGLIEYTVSVRGRTAEPHITISWPAAHLGLLGADMKLLDGEISFEQGAFNIKKIKLVGESADIGRVKNFNDILMTGQIPFNLSFMPPVFSPSQNELDLTVSASIEKLDSLPFLAMQNATINGNGNIDMKVRGTIQSPQFSGNATLKNIGYQYENVNVTDTNVKLTFDRNGINIEQATGKFNDGVFQCSNTIGLSGYQLTDLNISGKWNDVLWEQPGFVSATSEGAVQLLGTFDKPRLKGDVIVHDGSFGQSWQSIIQGIISKQAKGRSDVILDYPLVKNLELDLNVQIPQVQPNSFWLDTVGTKIQPLVNGRVVGPINPPERIVFVGQVNILEGEFSYFNRKFFIKTGTIENSSPYILDPKYNIEAEIASPIVNAKIPGAQEPKDVRITLSMTGTLQSPQPPILGAEVIKPGEQYDFDQWQILMLLAFGNIAGQEGVGVPYSTSGAATDFITRQAEMFVGGKIADKLHLRELQLGISDGEGSSPRFLITKEIYSQLAVTYISTYSLSAKPYLLGIEYKLNKNISIAGTRNEYGKFGMDLKYGIEW